MSGPVDVLPKLDWYVSVLGKIGSPEQAADLASVRAAVAELIEAQKATRRELRACQAVIHLAGGFDPAYVTGAQAAIKQADAALANVGGAK